MFNDPKHKNLINDIAGILNEHNKTYYENLLPEAVIDRIELCAEDIAEMELGHRTAENIGEVMKEYFYEGTRHARIKPTNEMSAEFYRRVYDVLSELKKSTLQSYASKSLRKGLDGEKSRNPESRKRGVEKAMRRLTGHRANQLGYDSPETRKAASRVQDSYEAEGDQIDELKSDTLRSYVYKRSGQVRSDLSTGKHSPKTNKKAKGVSAALSRLDARKQLKGAHPKSQRGQEWSKLARENPKDKNQ